MYRRLTAVFFCVSAALLAGAAAASPLAPQTSTLAGVTVKATPRSLSGALWEFELVFDTHIQNLRDDVAKSTVLIADGVTSYAPREWQGDPPGGHHRKGVLSFNPVSPAPQAIELRIQRAGEAAPRSFRWQLR